MRDTNVGEGCMCREGCLREKGVDAHVVLWVDGVVGKKSKAVSHGDWVTYAFVKTVEKVGVTELEDSLGTTPS